MKILFFIDGLYCGGKERRLLELMKGLLLHPDIKFELIVMSKEIYYTEVMDLKIPIHYYIRKQKKDISCFYKFYLICREKKPDIVHCWDSMTAVYLAPVCKLLSIIMINGMVVDSPVRLNIRNKQWLRARLTFPLSSVIVGNSKAGIQAYKAPAHKSRIIYNGFNFMRNSNLLSPDQIRAKLNIKASFLVGMVASFSGFKDYKTYYEAAMIILEKRNDVVFCALGDKTDSNTAKNLVRDEHLDNFRFLGKITEIESYVNAMDICVLSTFTEGISNSILEYMALGKPVIATSGGGTSEIVLDCNTGFLVAKSNPGEMADRIETLLNDEPLRTSMGKSGAERVGRYFSIETMVLSYIELYNKLLITEGTSVIL